MSMGSVIKYILSLCAFSTLVLSWREWEWYDTEGPGTRRGHSLSTYNTQLIVFGGRTEDATKTHIPKTYEIHRVNGTYEFLSYDKKVVQPDADHNVRVGVYFNDVWSYDVNCTRYADDSCRNKTWTLLRNGAAWGGCKYILGAQVCTHPSERWFHRAEVFSDNTMLVYGGFSPLCEDYCDDLWMFNFNGGSWTEKMELGSQEFGPGKRFKFSSIVVNLEMYIFGGFRIWHGFAHENSIDNDWNDYSQYPTGGYLNDLWVYKKDSNTWRNITGKFVCPNKNIVIEGGLEVHLECNLTWPPGRAGHSAVLFNNSMYIHGGYRTFFPYPSTTSTGVGKGILSFKTIGFTPYPSHPYYLGDMWKYDLNAQLWEKINYQSIIYTNDLETVPPARTEHSLVAVKGVFILFGGYISNYYFDDTWHFNVSTNIWNKQTTHVHPFYPSSCTDDLIRRKMEHSGMYSEYKPPTDLAVGITGYSFLKELHYGTAIFSVVAEPTRGTFEPAVYLPQARRQAPGWDGCRDRDDNRTDLPNTLRWAHPSQRAGHMAVYNAFADKVFIYGGYGFANESAIQAEDTLEAISFGDLWQYDLKNCPKNCSLHGNCYFSNCICDDGYYGIDCSNSTCPGSFSSVSPLNSLQQWKHCCFSGFEHTDNDTYVENIQKYPCTSTNIHYSNGVCDGFGKCICKPPFIGEDCSIRDCGFNCSGNGYCSVEFPNSRCMCDEGWYGKYCEEAICLNNCTYPNGHCVNGSCYCSMVYEPYNNTLEYFPLMGEDCSFIIPFAHAVRIQSSFVYAFIMTLMIILCEQFKVL